MNESISVMMPPEEPSENKKIRPSIMTPERARKTRGYSLSFMSPNRERPPITSALTVLSTSTGSLGLEELDGEKTYNNNWCDSTNKMLQDLYEACREQLLECDDRIRFYKWIYYSLLIAIIFFNTVATTLQMTTFENIDGVRYTAIFMHALGLIFIGLLKLSGAEEKLVSNKSVRRLYDKLKLEIKLVLKSNTKNRQEAEVTISRFITSHASIKSLLL